MRRVLIPIAAGVMIGVVVAGFVAYFTVASGSGYSVDGLGRPLGPSPWFARWLFGANKEWAGLGWFFIDLLWFWGGIVMAVFLGRSSASASTESRLPKSVAVPVGIAIVLTTAYATQRVIKIGINFGLEAGLGFNPEVMPANASAKFNLPFVERRKWSSFTKREQEIYIGSLLETWSFVVYGMTDPKKPPREFSAFTACVESKKTEDFRDYVVNNAYALGEIDKPPVAHLFNGAALLCEKYADKGDGSLRPARLLRKEVWEKFNDEERKLYLMGYVDFVHFSEHRLLDLMNAKDKTSLDQESLRFLDKKKQDLQVLETCLGQQGIDGLLITLSTQSIEWQHPLPWSVATALGKTCFRNKEK